MHWLQAEWNQGQAYGAGAAEVFSVLACRGADIALDVARGLYALHSQRIVHMDIKSPNVLLTREYLAKIADVGKTLVKSPFIQAQNEAVPGYGKIKQVCIFADVL